MSKYTCDVLRAAISPEWLAKTYSEYLLTCAKAKLDLIDSINTAVADDSLEDLIDNKSNQYVDICEGINNQAIQQLEILGQNVNDLPVDDPTYDEILNEILFIEDEGSSPVTYSLTSSGQGLVSFSAAFNGSTSHHYTLAEVESFINTYKNVSRDDIVAQNAQVANAINALTTQVMEANELSNNVPLTLEGGYVNARDTVYAIIRRGCLGSEYSEFELAAVNSANASVGNLTFNFSDIMSELKGSVASTITWAQAFSAAAIENIADRMIWFENTIKNYFNDFNDKVNASINTVRNVLNNLHNGVSELIDVASDMFGWDKLTESPAVVSETDVYAYTGASPLGDVDLHTVKGVATVAAGAVVAAGKACWSLIKKGAKKLWSKIRPLAKAITTDPEDIAVINKEADGYTVDGMSYNCKHVALSFYAKSINDADDCVDWIEDHKDEWYAFKTYFGEALFNMSAAIRILNVVVVDVCWQLKPRCLNHKTAYDYNLVHHVSDGTLSTTRYLCKNGDFTAAKISNWYNSNNCYAGDDDTEGEKIMGFEDALICMQALFQATLQEMASSSNQDLDIPGFISNWGGSDLQPVDYNSGQYFDARRRFTTSNSNISNGRIYMQSVTNRSFLETLTGYAESSQRNPNSGVDEAFGWYDQTVFYMGDPEQGVYEKLAYNGYKTRLDYDIISLLMCIIMNQAMERMHNPLDYSYIPYSCDNYIWDEPRYKIKTDANNAAIADIFVSAIIAVVVIVLAVVVCKSLIKVFKLKKYTKLQNQVHALDAQMWKTDGAAKVLTPKEAWLYRRKLNKINKLQSAASGFASSVSSNSTIVDKVKEYTSNVITQVKDSLSLGKTVKPADWSQDTSFNLSDKMTVQDSAYISSLYYGVFRRKLPQE